MLEVFPWLFLSDLLTVEALDEDYLYTSKIALIISLGCSTRTKTVESRNNFNLKERLLFSKGATRGMGKVIQSATNSTQLKQDRILKWRVYYVSFPEVRDDPSEFMLEVWERCSTLLRQFYKENDANVPSNFKAVVHCVQGQSRSVSAIIAFLVSTRILTLEEALQHLQKVNPNISINPGFLTQLYLLANYGNSSAEYNLFFRQFKHHSQQASFHCTREIYNPEIEDIDYSIPFIDTSFLSNDTMNTLNHNRGSESVKIILCLHCRKQIADESNEIKSSIDCCEYLTRYCDNFWRDYLGIHTKKSLARAPIHGNLVMEQMPWMTGEPEILCPHCNCKLGDRTSSNFDLLTPFLPCDLITFEKKNVVVRRKRKTITYNT